MKKAVLICLVLLFFLGACKKKEELILGNWVKVKNCPEKGECPNPDKGKGSHLEILSNGLAKYDTFHLTYKMKDDDIHFNLADLAFDLEYRIVKVNDKELQLLNKKENNVEYFEKN